MATPPVDGETLLARLNAIFTEDPAIDEIGLLFGIEAEDLTVDDAFQLAEHKLGVAFSAGPIVFRAARTRFHALNAALFASEIAGPESDAFVELLACTRAVLCISADFYTAWNTRKAFVDRGWLLAADEVAFTSLVFSLHPKSIDTWAYRRWLATRLVQELEPRALAEFFVQQVAMCTILAERAPRNYHAWSFRHWLVSRFNDPMQLERELVAMQAWCETHLKDHSGWNHRQHVLKCLLQTTDAKPELLVKECAFLSKLLAPYPMYEALWCHRRFVMQSLLKQAPPLDARDETTGVVDACDAVLGAIGQAATTEETHDWLQHQFATVQASLVDDLSSVLRSALLDIAIAWRCGDRFARRYAAWLVQRLLTNASLNANATAAIVRVGRAMRASLTTDDALLDHLWRATA